MKVLSFTNMYPNHKLPYFGVFVKNQVDALNKIDGLTVDVLNVVTKKAGGSHVNYFRVFVNLIYIRVFGNYDIVHCHHAYCFFLAKLLFFRCIVYTCHEGEYFRRNFIEEIKLNAIKSCDYCIFVSELMYQEINKSKKIFLPCSVDLSYFPSVIDKKKSREELGFTIDEKIIFFPADPQRKEKRFYILKEAFTKLGNEFRIITGGDIEYQDMHKWYSASDLVISCSEYESDGMIYKESILCNRFFISPNVGNAKYYSKFGGMIVEDFNSNTLADEISLFFEYKPRKKSGVMKFLDINVESKLIFEIYKEVL
ncbi:glycosyltransferase [Vibrio splendidus]|uniref:glycosyltransferase n=1 Tax=Vibrio splendidus TaxID=29497 RepID=UPI000C84A7C4|nr:glycosyltransferase [Vibrio splendidus]PMI77433.1 hypothetical protein BCU38_24155 [Vibrio splendidus]